MNQIISFTSILHQPRKNNIEVNRPHQYDHTCLCDRCAGHEAMLRESIKRSKVNRARER